MQVVEGKKWHENLQRQFYFCKVFTTNATEITFFMHSLGRVWLLENLSAVYKSMLKLNIETIRGM